MKNLVNTLRLAGHPAKVLKTADGTRLLLLPHGARVLGLFAPQSDANFYWTNPSLRSVKTAAAFFASEAWHNSGGDRTWLAPEVDIFLPDFPRLEHYSQPRSLDPGHYRLIDGKDGILLENRLNVRLSRLNINVSLKIVKSFGPASNPLRNERGIDMRGVEYAGYTQRTSLELTGAGRTARKVRVGLWNLVQLPHGGELLLPTFSRCEPYRNFSTVGTIPPADLAVGERLIRYRMRQKGEHKISLRAASVTGRAGYLLASGKQWSLVIRNYSVNPSGEYVDVPWDEPTWPGFAVQACNVDSALGSFSELEYHVPAIGRDTGSIRCEDISQIWAFRGPQKPLLQIVRRLVAGERFLP